MKSGAVVSLSWNFVLSLPVLIFPPLLFLYLYHCKTLNLVEFSQSLFRRLHQFYYVIKASVSFANVYELVNICLRNYQKWIKRNEAIRRFLLLKQWLSSPAIWKKPSIIFFYTSASHIFSKSESSHFNVAVGSTREVI